MQVTIVTNGIIRDTNFLRSVIKNSNYIICADGAIKYLMDLNVYPDLLVGDLDSINKKALEWVRKNNIRVQQFPVKKDMTDTELAVEFALEQKPNKIIITGATGTRIDHSLSNIMLLYRIHKMGVNAVIIDEINYITITDNILKMKCQIGQTISIIPIGGDAKGVTLEGLEYSIINYNIEMGSSLGISNKSTAKEIIISVKDGILLVAKICPEE
ncbi:MAG TPA: thiamine diphosphokinase [Oscillospiraceae bacterium]|nr:thiamine diphosphokinase [Oscillospiraceae bacterium]